MTGTPSASDPPSRILVVGGGVAALEFVLGLAELAPGRADVEIVAPQSFFDYRPLAIAETFGVGRPYRLELDRFASCAGARCRRGRVLSVNEADHLALTASGERLRYDLLVVACGARPQEGLPGALTFRGEQDAGALRALLAELEDGSVSSVAFVVPPGASWPLPLYELALMSAARLEQHGRRDRRIALVTPETSPLARFDGAASQAVAALLAAAGIELHCGQHAAEVVDGTLRLIPDGQLAAERVVTLPRLRGPHIAGLPSNPEGFIPTDLHGLVWGATDVYAAGDATTFPVKQGGIAVQQAGAVAEAVAARLGAPLRPTPFRPLLRGLLLTGEVPRFLWSDPTGGHGETSTVAAHPLWWPPGKIAGGRLAAFLRAEGLPVPPPPAGPATLPVEVDLSLDDGALSSHAGEHL